MSRLRARGRGLRSLCPHRERAADSPGDPEPSWGLEALSPRLVSPSWLGHDRSVNRAEAERFADSWVQAWNAHDLDLVLGHFSDEVLFTSPVAAQLLAGSDGVIRGKRALRRYWAEGLRLIPDLHFDVVGVYVGVGALVINYSNQKGALVRSYCP